VAWPEVPVIFVGRRMQAQQATEALANGARACLVAPLRAPDLLRTLGQVTAKPRGAGRTLS
jgi:CheY-like chemotaxis protein